MRRIMAQPSEKLQRAPPFAHSGPVQRELSPSRAVQPGDRAPDGPSLVEALRRGEPEAFERLVLTYQHRIFSIALRMLGDRGGPGEGRPGGTLEAGEIQAALHRAIAELDEERRIVVVLRDLHGLAYEEIAAALELPLNTVRSRLHRARMELKERLERFWS